MTPVQPVRGTQSLFGLEADRFHRVVRAFNEVRRLYRFRRLEIPVFETTEVFARAIGETTDIVSKEMYSFPDKGGDMLTLRPEFTAGIARAFISQGWKQHAPLKGATWGPAFRYERPQKGRFRQFHQIDAEVIGAPESAADIELLAFAHQLLEHLKIRELTELRINTLGDADSRGKWRLALIRYFERFRDALSEESKVRLQVNPLRILDSKDARDREISRDAPRIDQFLTSEAGSVFEEVLHGLTDLGIQFRRDHSLVRGLDYYRHTTYEFVTSHLGAQGAVLGGGRYDGLIETMGGDATPAVGWAAGIERLALLLPDRRTYGQVIAIVPEDDGSEELSQKIAYRLRSNGVTVDYLYRGSARKRIEKYQKRGATTALFVQAIYDRPDVVGTLNIKHYRRFGHDTEQRVAKRLSSIFDVLSIYEIEPEGLFNGRRVDLVLRPLT